MKTVKVLFHYAESVTPPRCRKPRLVSRDDGVLDVEIQSLTSAQAKPAIRASGEFCFRDATHEFEYLLHYFNGKFWSSLNLSSGGEPASQTVGRDDWSWAQLPEVLDLRQGGRNSSYEYGYHENYARKGRAEVEALIRAFAREHILIDGAPFRQVGEPSFEICTFGLGRNHGSTAVLASRFDASRPSAEMRQFPVTNLNEAIAMAAAVAEHRGDTDSLPMQYQGVKYEVVLPEVISSGQAAVVLS